METTVTAETATPADDSAVDSLAPGLQTQDDGDTASAFTDALRDGDRAGGDDSGNSESGPGTAPVNAAPPAVGQDDTQAVSRQQPAAQADDVLAGLRSAAQRLGIQVEDGASSDQLALEALRQLHAAQPMLQFARQAISGQQQPETQSESSANSSTTVDEWSPQSYFQERFGGHSWKQEYTQAVNSGAVVRDEATRLWKPAPGFELAVGSIVGQMNEFETRNTQFWSDLSRSNPLEKIYNDLLPALQRAWQADVDSRLKQQVQSASQEDVIASFESQNASWLYRQDPVSGQYVPTDQGQMLVDAIKELRQSGVQDASQLLALSLRMTGLDKQAAGQNAGDQAAPAPAVPQDTPQAATPAAAAETAQGPKPSFLDSAKEAARRRASHSPSVNSHAGGDGVSQDMTEGDLDNLFVQAIAGTR